MTSKHIPAEAAVKINECRPCAVDWCSEYRANLYKYCKRHAYRDARYGDTKFTPPDKAQLSQYREWSSKVLQANANVPHVIGAQQMLRKIVQHCLTNKNEHVRAHANRLNNSFDAFKALHDVFTIWLWSNDCLHQAIQFQANEIKVRDRLIGRKFLSVTPLNSELHKCSNPSGRVCQIYGELITQNLLRIFLALTQIVDESKKMEQEAKEESIELNYPQETLELANKMLNQLSN